jgi:hypothetical protein
MTYSDLNKNSYDFLMPFDPHVIEVTTALLNI